MYSLLLTLIVLVLQTVVEAILCLYSMMIEMPLSPRTIVEPVVGLEDERDEDALQKGA